MSRLEGPARHHMLCLTLKLYILTTSFSASAMNSQQNIGVPYNWTELRAI